MTGEGERGGAPAAALPPELPSLLIDDLVRDALREDLGRAGDVTTAATIPPEATARVVMGTRESGTLAGIAVAAAAFRAMDPRLRFEALATDGDRLEAGQALARIEGTARAVLSAERVALNFLMHMSGVATHTRRFSDAIAHTDARVTCTRKTLPLLRAVEKYAVRCGGGSNHRFGLDDAILIKDNHIAVCGGVREAVRAARAYAGHLLSIEIEVDTLDQLREAVAEGPDAVLLDNMDPDTLREGVGIVRDAPRAIAVEASGNVDLDTVAAIAEAGPDYISTSKITMSAPTLDIGLDIALDIAPSA